MANHMDKALPPKPRVVVGLDFGTTYSGFAFAHVSDPEKIYTYYDYPQAGGGKPYCKTLTASYYKILTPVEAGQGRWQLQSWGYSARTDYEHDIQALRTYRMSQNDRSDAPSTQPSVGIFLSRFKLHLASRNTEALSASPLPQGLAIEQVIEDYLRELGGLILKHMQDKYGAHFRNEMIQWCITVPSIWDNSATATMKACMVAAGLVSPHPVVTVLEPEAASIHCHKVMGELTPEVGDKLLVADIGGGTSDIVTQEVVSVGKSGYRVKEVTTSSGGLCGGTYVDSRLMGFLQGRIGPCFQECILKHPNVYGQLMKLWESTKSSFGRGQNVTTMNLPNKLAMEWVSYDWEMGSLKPKSQEYDELEISDNEMQSIFDPIVQENLDLIQEQLVEAGGKVQVLVLVGGFSESPYLLHRIKQTFEGRVGKVICPPNPGSAICQGAVTLATHPNIVVSRICKRTYGLKICMPFEKGVDPIERLVISDGVEYCDQRFLVLVKKGDEVMINELITEKCTPLQKEAKRLAIRLVSCEERNPPRYAIGRLVKEEGELLMDISGDMTLDRNRKIEVSMCFGGSSVEVKAKTVNFMAQQVQFPIQIDYLLN